MKQLNLVLMLLLLAVTINAQTTIWLGGSTDWDDPANWSDGVPATGFTVTIPSTPPNGANFPVFTGGPLIDYSIQIFGGSLIFDAVVYNTGSVINSGGGSIINNQTFINAGMVQFNNNAGSFTNNGLVDNYGLFTNAGTSVLTNTAGNTFNNFGDIENFGLITNDGNFLNLGDIVSTNVLVNNGNLVNRGFLDSAFGSSFTNDNGGDFTNESGAIFEINGMFTNAGDIVTDGSFFIQTAGATNNSGSIINNGAFDLSGPINNTGTFTNNNDMLINDSGQFTNENSFTNNGTVTLSICGQIIQNANNTIAGTILSDGIIYEIGGDVDVTSNLDFGSEFSDLSQRKDPEVRCRAGVAVFLDENGNGTLDINSVDLNSFGFCGAAITTRTLSQNSFTTADIGVNEVMLTVTDEFGFQGTCSGFVNVFPFSAPVIAIDNPDIDLNCSADITVQVQPGAFSTVVNFDEPVPSTNCTSSGISGNFVCKERTITPTNRCSIGELFGIFIKFDGLNSRYIVENGVFTEFLDGSATLTGLAVNNSDSNIKFEVNTVFTGRTTTAPNPPKEHLCNLSTNTSDFYYYTAFSGTLVGTGSAAGALAVIESYGDAFQVGVGANVVQSTIQLGASGWFALDLINQPTGSLQLTSPIGQNEQSGDIHINLSGDNSVCENGGTMSCSNTSNTISGFDFLGEFNGSRYFLSTSTANYQTANNAVTAEGGHLLTISDAVENEFIRGHLAEGTSVWIGLSDEGNEGNFEWETGEPVNYINWALGDPNGGTNSNVARLRQNDGYWTDRSETDNFFYVLEMECDFVLPNCSTVTSIPNATLIGEFENSKYFISNSSSLNYAEAEALAINGGGHLATVSDAAENEYIRSNLPSNSSAWLGYSDEASEGNYVWVTSEPTTYTNWQNGEPNDSLGIDNFARIQQNTGMWTDRNGATNHYYAIIEVDCSFNPIATFFQHCFYGGSSAEFGLGTYNTSDFTAIFPNNELSSIQIPAGLKVTLYNDNLTGTTQVLTADNACLIDIDFNDKTTSITVELLNATGGNGLTIQQIAGGLSGSEFPIGDSEVAFEVTDNCGNQEICIFNVTVEANPADIVLTDCPTEVVVNTAPGASSAQVLWTEPTATSNCFENSATDVSQVFGPLSGSLLPIGTQQITYSVEDSCGNFSSCVFPVTVVEVPATFNLVNCPGDLSVPAPVGSTSATVTWDVPTGTTDCFTGGVNVNQLIGPANGSSFPIGTTTIAYVLSDDCGNAELCLFTVTVIESCPAAGTPCNDNDPTTGNDVEDGSCNCAGTACDLTVEPQIRIDNGSWEFTNNIQICGIGSKIEFAAHPAVNGNTWSWTGPNGFMANTRVVLLSNSAGIDLSGTYTVSYTDADGCTDVATLDLTIYDNPTATVTSTGASCLGDDGSITFTFPNHPTRTHLEFSVDGGLTYFVGVPDDSGSVTYNNFGEGTYDLFVRWGNTQCPVSLGTFNIAEVPAIGSSCNDGNPSTQNDMINSNCECEGTPISCDASASPITLAGGGTETTICVDGVGDPLGVTLTGTSVGANAGWIITDDANNILALPPAPPFDLDPAGPGTCLIWYVRYENDFAGNTVGNNLSDLTGCYDLSNGITVVRQEADGATVNLVTGGTSYTGTAGDIVFDVENTTTATNLSYWYIITDNNDNILGFVNSGNTIDLSPAPPGECHIWGWSYSGQPDPVVGDPITSLADGSCEDISSNFITVIRETSCPAAGTACDDGNANTINDVEDGNCNCAGMPIPTDCKVYTIQDVQPVCHASFANVDAGVFFRRALDSNGLCTGTDYEVWKAGSDLVLIENGDGTAQMSGTILNGNTVANVSISYEGFSFVGQGWTNGCYNNNVTIDYYYTSFAGTVSYNGQSYTLTQKSADFTLGEGAQNAADGFGFGMWVGGTWGECIEVFGSLTLKQAGDTCDDGNSMTENDVILADGCSCQGTPINTGGGGCTTTENLALNGTATESSEQFGALGERAIDGDTNGNFWAGSTTLTKWEAQPWIEIDLGQISNIESFNVYNRTDCCDGFLSNYHILISDVPFTSTNLAATIAQAGVVDIFEAAVAGTPTAVTAPANTTGRYVRIQLEGTSFLGLAEIEIIGCVGGGGPCPTAGTACNDGNANTTNDIEDGNCGCAGTPINTVDCPALSANIGDTCNDGNANTTNDVVNGNCNCVGTPINTVDCPALSANIGDTCNDGNANTTNDVVNGNCNCAGTPINTGGACTTTTNLALDGTATESSVQFGATGSRAIDGNTNGDFWNGNSVALTAWEAQPWIEIDLGQISNIEEVRVYNRTDCCQGFLKYYHILVSETPFTSTSLAATQAQAGVDDYFEAAEGGAGTPTTTTTSSVGRYVRIQLEGTSFLGLAEIEIIGCTSTGGGSGCPVAGTACNDGNANTTNDVEDGNCACEGTPINTVDCPALSANIGDSCNDGDANTTNDVVNANCNCTGTPINTVDCPALSANIGDSCNDGDASTTNDVINANCNCEGTPTNTGGGCTTTTNVALNGTATQSSTLSAGGIVASADKSIDGNTNGVFFTGNASQSSVSATNNSFQPYWEVELDDTYLIEQIDVYNRTDGSDRSNDVYVLISDIPFSKTDLAGARDEAIWEEFIPGLVGSPSTVLPNVSGKYVRIHMQGSGYLVLGEVEVYGCVSNSTGLAVPNMLYFNAEKDGITTNVDWMMAKDVNVDFYEVEVSTDGTNFRLLDDMNSHQVNAPRQYETVDLHPSFGENYYRLKVNYLDGTYFYSNTRRVNFEIDFDDVIVYPNPTDNLINIALRDFAGKTGTIEIYNSLGQRMTGRDYQSFPTIPAVFDVSNYVNGIYTISIKVENHKRFTKKFAVTQR